MEESEKRADSYDVVIGGAGIGGLTCGALLAKEGLKVAVVEKKKIPGGYTAPIENKGYSFQFPQVTTGCEPKGDITKILEHLEKPIEMIEVNPYHRCIFPEHDISFSSSLEILMNTLKEEFQPQTTQLKMLFDHMTKVHEKTQSGQKARKEGKSGGTKALLRSMQNSLGGRGSSALNLLDRFITDPKLVRILAAPWQRLGSPPWRLSSLSLIDFIMNQSKGVHVPRGGFHSITGALVESITQSGGELHYSEEIKELSLDKGRVVGLTTKSGRDITTDTFISDIDTKYTFLKLLKEEDCPVRIRTVVQEQAPSISGFTVFLGLSKTVSREEMDFGIALSEPSYDLEAALEALSESGEFPEPSRIPWSLSIPTLHDDSCAPAGKTTLSISIPAIPYSFMDDWGTAGNGFSSGSPTSLKEKFAEIAVSAVSGSFPDLISNVEAYEAVTPLEFEKYVTANQGCWYDLAPEPGQTDVNRMGPGTPVRGLYLTGSKTFTGGGIHASMLGGLYAANAALRELPAD